MCASYCDTTTVPLRLLSFNNWHNSTGIPQYEPPKIDLQGKNLSCFLLILDDCNPHVASGIGVHASYLPNWEWHLHYGANDGLDGPQCADGSVGLSERHETRWRYRRESDQVDVEIRIDFDFVL